MNILLLASHAVAEFDDIRMLADLGYDVFAPGGYEDPTRSGEGIRPPLPDAPQHPELVALCNEVRAAKGDPGDRIDWAKAAIHGDLIDWADAIIVHHFPEHWIGGQWDRIGHKRVIWRTCGQSVPGLEAYLSGFKGLQVVRYSPKEQPHFERHGAFAGSDAVIRFGKYPADFRPWVGWETVIGNVTQDMVARGDSVGLGYWQRTTEGLPTKPSGKGSEALGGTGLLSYEAMLDYLAAIRCYLYTGTTPASYTLGLMEAMLTGVPVVSIGAQDWAGGWSDIADLFEGGELTGMDRDQPRLLRMLLSDDQYAHDVGRMQRQRALALFGIETVGAQWREFLS